MGRLFLGIRAIEKWVIIVAIFGVAALTIVNVFSRTVLEISLAEAEELTQFLILAITFVGLSYASGLGRHIRMTALYDQLGPHARRRMMIVISGTTGLLMLLMAWYSVRYIQVVWKLGTVSPVLNIPYALVYCIVPAGFLLSSIQNGLTVVRNLGGDAVYLSFDRKDEYDTVESIPDENENTDEDESPSTAT